MVEIDSGARHAWPWLPRAMPGHCILVGPTGEVVKLNPDGTVDELLPGGHPHGGIASDPNRRRDG
jgi:hypothetical protein